MSAVQNSRDPIVPRDRVPITAVATASVSKDSVCVTPDLKDPTVPKNRVLAIATLGGAV